MRYLRTQIILFECRRLYKSLLTVGSKRCIEICRIVSSGYTYRTCSCLCSLTGNHLHPVGLLYYRGHIKLHILPHLDIIIVNGSLHCVGIFRSICHLDILGKFPEANTARNINLSSAALSALGSDNHYSRIGTRTVYCRCRSIFQHLYTFYIRRIDIWIRLCRNTIDHIKRLAAAID